jgi:hypothetical protein
MYTSGYSPTSSKVFFSLLITLKGLFHEILGLIFHHRNGEGFELAKIFGF